MTGSLPPEDAVSPEASSIGPEHAVKSPAEVGPSRSPHDAAVVKRSQPDDAIEHFELAPQPAAPAPTAPALSISVQDALARVQREEEREREAQDRQAREEATLDGKLLTDPLVPAHLTRWRQVAIIGAVFVVIAFVLAWRYAPRAGFVVGLIAAYSAALHACLGLGALWLQARLEERPLGNWREALARFFASLGAFQLVLHLPLDTGYPVLTKGLLALLACATFLGLVMLLFRWPWRRALMVGGLQVLIWVALTLHMWLGSLVLPPK